MKISAISNNNYIQKSNFNKNHNPSFGMVTNIVDIELRVMQDVKQGKVTKEYAMKVLNKLRGARFSMVEGLEHYHNGTFDSRSDATSQLVNNLYFSALKENRLSEEDLPLRLEYSVEKNEPDRVRMQRPLSENRYVFQLRTSFPNMVYKKSEKKFVPVEEDMVRDISKESISGPSYNNFTQALDHLTEGGHLEEMFYTDFADPVVDNLRRSYYKNEL